MTDKEFNFVKSCNPQGKTLDIGAFDVNGSIKPLVSDYTGIDMRPGPGVDIVCNAHELPFPDNTFDTVIACSIFEHDDKFWLTASEMWRVLKPKGKLIVTMPSISFPRHDYPSDYWRATKDGLATLFPATQVSEDSDFAYLTATK